MADNQIRLRVLNGAAATYQDLIDLWEGKYGEIDHHSLLLWPVGSHLNTENVAPLIKEAIERGDFKADDLADMATLFPILNKAIGLFKG